METKEYGYIDKSNWRRGIWDLEPDKIQWEDKETGLPCLIVRNEYFGILCGYVGINSSHEYFGVDKFKIKSVVHGGITFSGNGLDRGTDLSHELEGEEIYSLWWLGFDCNHYQDVFPISIFQNEVATYKDISFVKEQVKKLASELWLLRLNKLNEGIIMTKKELKKIKIAFVDGVSVKKAPCHEECRVELEVSKSYGFKDEKSE